MIYTVSYDHFINDEPAGSTHKTNYKIGGFNILEARKELVKLLEVSEGWPKDSIKPDYNDDLKIITVLEDEDYRYEYKLNHEI